MAVMKNTAGAETGKGALRTRWGEAATSACPLDNHPRPQFRRPDWLCLNGHWSYDVLPDGERPKQYSGSILVPYSPEASLSGAARGPKAGETAWYARSFTLPQGFLKDRLLLHFGAVDQWCEVFVNGRSAGVHQGGYLPFTLDITPQTDPAGENRLTVSVRDQTEAGADSYGKQSTSPGGIWYTAQSGIWQTVWLESVPENCIDSIRITPDPARETVLLEIPGGAGTDYAVLAGGKLVVSGAFGPDGRAEVSLPGCVRWTPEKPFLYDLLLKRGGDLVRSYFAMRSVAVKNGQFLLNGQPIVLSGLLDQGYWPEGLYTPPSDEAMVYDIETARSLGFNLLRKHVKVEPLRWYYHCDRLGMLVWQDFPNGGEPYSKLWTAVLPTLGVHISDKSYRRLGRGYERGRKQFEREAAGIVSLLYNSPSVVCWSVFNEGWGQFDALRQADSVRALDPTRPIDHASGWHDQGGGDFCSRHIYFRRVSLKPDKRAQAITECGGYSLRVFGHAGDRVFGYRRYASSAALTEAIEKLYREQLIPLKEQGLCAVIYTQLSDVEEELNGLLTWDRKVLKVDAARMLALNDALKAPTQTERSE